VPNVVGGKPVGPAGISRIGCVKYLNARPLIHGWPGEVVFDHPTNLCRQLAGGSLDVALVSSFEMLRNPIYLMVDDVCVSSRGPVYSVFLAHDGELAEITHIEVDPASQTSVNLLRCLLAEAKLSPNLVAARSIGEAEVTTRHAKLLIGDQGIHFRMANAGRLRFWDLGEAWTNLTRLPFVYAVWLIRPEVSNPKLLAHHLRACRDRNLENLDSIVAANREFPTDFCSHYLRECLAYRLGHAEKEGLGVFRILCEKNSILAPQTESCQSVAAQII
jgi:chorismate dehydratase